MARELKHLKEEKKLPFCRASYFYLVMFSCSALTTANPVLASSTITLFVAQTGRVLTWPDFLSRMFSGLRS
jgi:hypothetical protein